QARCPAERRARRASGARRSAATKALRPRRQSLSGGGQRFAARLLALVGDEMALANADRLGRDLDQLVVGDEFDGVLQSQRDRRREKDRLVLARGADVGELLGAYRIHDEIVVPAV